MILFLSLTQLKFVGSAHGQAPTSHTHTFQSLCKASLSLWVPLSEMAYLLAFAMNTKTEWWKQLS